MESASIGNERVPEKTVYSNVGLCKDARPLLVFWQGNMSLCSLKCNISFSNSKKLCKDARPLAQDHLYYSRTTCLCVV